MPYLERSIKFAFNRITGDVLEADVVFDNVKDAYVFRTEFNRNHHDLYCRECYQKIIVSVSKYSKLHFRHLPKSDPCLLKGTNLSWDEIEKINNILKAKESDRHKFLKNLIYSKLLKVPGVDSTSVTNDDRVITRGEEKRRPDVYCKYFDKEIVFEIQLSTLSQRYILSRHDFYKKHGIYLIWILDKFDVRGQNQTELDIKYLEKHHNFFHFDENSIEFRLTCEFKFPFLTEENEILSKWINKSVSLKQLKFDPMDIRAFYFDYIYYDNRCLLQQKVNWEFKREKEKLKEEHNKLELADRNSNEILCEIAQLRKDKIWNYSHITAKVNSLDQISLVRLNTLLDIPNRMRDDKPLLNYWINTAQKDDIPFINFLIENVKIELDVNKSNSPVKSLLQEIYENESLHKSSLMKLLFKRGYIYTSADDQYLSSLPDPNYLIRDLRILYQSCNKILDKSFIENLFVNDKLVYIIESAKGREIIHFNYKPHEWIAFANNAIQSYPQYWPYIRAAFKHYNLWNKLLLLDKKKTFHNKMDNWEIQEPARKWDFDNVFKYLYPEVSIS